MKRPSAWVSACAVLVLCDVRSDAGIVSSGDVKPPFSLTGPSSTFTVPVNGSTSGGVIVGDIAQGDLLIDGAWTLNTTYGIIANGIASSTPNASLVSVTGGSTWNMSLDLDVGSGAAGVANVSFGSAIHARSIRLASNNTGSGLMHVNANSTVSSLGATLVGWNGGGSLTVEGSSSLQTGWLVLGDGFGSAGHGLFAGASQLQATNGGVFVGGRGLGTLAMNSGSTGNALFTSVGYDPDSPNGPSNVASQDHRLTLSGTGTFYNNTEGLGVGFNTKGSLYVGNGARLDAGFLEVSRFGDDGFLSVTSGAKVNLRPGGSISTVSLIFATEANSFALGEIKDAGTLVNAVHPGAFAEVARRGTASVSVTNGAVVNAGYSLVATEAGSQGTLTVFGNGTQWNAAETLEVGRSGNGNLAVNAGASVSTPHFLIVGGATGGSGELIVYGAGTSPSTVTSGQQAIIGLHGNASVLVQNGARLESHKASSVTSTSGLLAQFEDSVASVLVSEPGSIWTSDGGVNVGFRGVGTLTVQNSGRVESTDGIVARLPGSTGTVSVIDADSRWVISNALYVGGRPASGAPGAEGQAGPGGTATIQLGAGSAITVGDSLRQFNGGTIDLTGGGSLNVAGGTATSGTLRIASGGTLYASGVVKGTLINHGDFSAGESIGILQVVGTLQTTGTTRFDIGSTTSFDKIIVSGSATVGGSLVLNISGSPALGETQRLDLITANSLGGTFSTVTGNQVDSTHWLAVLYRPNKVTLALAKPGDATLDGIINFDDLLVLAQNYNQSGAGFDWRRGDFDGNNMVNFDDLLALAQRYGTASVLGPSAGPGDVWADWAFARSLVPEPSMLGLLVMAGWRRRRR